MPEIHCTPPRLTLAQAPLTHEISVINEQGEPQRIAIPAERALTVYLNKRELVTLMTLGAHPELLVLGYLRNQRLVESASQIESITVDWDVGAAAVNTRCGVDALAAHTAPRVVTTGCGQGSMFSSVMENLDGLRLPPADRKARSGPGSPSPRTLNCLSGGSFRLASGISSSSWPTNCAPF